MTFTNQKDRPTAVSPKSDQSRMKNGSSRYFLPGLRQRRLIWFQVSLAAATRTVVRELPDFALMIDNNSAWGSPTFSHPAIVQRTMRAPKQTPLLTLKFHNEAGWSGAHNPTFRS